MDVKLLGYIAWAFPSNTSPSSPDRDNSGRGCVPLKCAGSISAPDRRYEVSNQPGDGAGYERYEPNNIIRKRIRMDVGIGPGTAK